MSDETENERPRYLPMDCPECGRRRLLFVPASNKLWCEKCGRDTWDRDEWEYGMRVVARD